MELPASFLGLKVPSQFGGYYLIFLLSNSPNGGCLEAPAGQIFMNLFGCVHGSWGIRRLLEFLGGKAAISFGAWNRFWGKQVI